MLTANEWSIVTSLATLAIAYSSGINPKWGWRLSLANQVPWAVFGIVTHQYGFIALSVGLGSVYALNLWRNRGRDYRSPTRQIVELEAANRVLAAELARLRAEADRCPASTSQKGA